MNRERLTITLRSDLLKYLDGLIDGDKLRNRSHAIEYYLSKALGVRAAKVLILAGGKPVFFESENKSLPKSMVKIVGKPLLEHTLHRLKVNKITDVYISISEGGEIIQNYFQDGGKFGMRITYIQQKPGNTGTAQPLLEAKQNLAGSGFLLIYGDVFTDIDFADFVEFHRMQKTSVCTMALSSSESPSMWGVCKMQGSKIVEFEEKPKNPKTFSHLINAGMYYMEPEIFSFIKPSAVKLESDVFPRLADEGKLAGYPFDDMWLDISSSAAYKQAQKQMTLNN